MNLSRFAPIAASFVALLAWAAAGCGDAGGSDQSRKGAGQSGPSLQLGSTGADVRALHEYLTQFGYFPNPALQESYPRWRPIVAQAPADPLVYDVRTAEAVRALQANSGLPSTGVVDERIRAILRTPRCGVPDGIVPLDPSDKFALWRDEYPQLTQGNGIWNYVPLPITYRVLAAPNNTVSISDIRNAARSAFQTWHAATGSAFTFRDVTGQNSADIDIGVDKTLTTCAADGSEAPGFSTTTGAIVHGIANLNPTCKYSVAATTPSGASDLQSLLLHEFGHALGLIHTPYFTAVMYPSGAPGTQKRALTLEELVPMQLLYERWEQSTGAAVDISGGNAGQANFPWILGTNHVGDPYDFGIFRYNGALGWDQDEAGGAGVSISVGPNDVPWVTNINGEVWFKPAGNPFNGTWQQVTAPFGPITAYRVAVGADGSVWAFGDPTSDGGDASIYKLSPDLSAWSLDVSGGMGTRITVGPTGVPWVVNSLGDVWRRTTSDPANGTWELLPALASGVVAVDVGLNNDGLERMADYAYATGSDGAVYLWNEQEAFGFPGEPARKTWVPVTLTGMPSTARALRVGVGPFGRAWIVDSTLTIWVPQF